MSRFRAVAWDLDGTLIESEGLHQRALIESSAAFGVDPTDLADEAFHGIHIFDVWMALRSRFPKGVGRSTWLGAIEQHYVTTPACSYQPPAQSRPSSDSPCVASLKPAFRIRVE